MSSASPVTIRQLRGRMARSILFLFLPISLVPALVLGSIFFLFRARLSAEQIPSAPGAFLASLPAGYLLAGISIFILALAASRRTDYRDLAATRLAQMMINHQAHKEHEEELREPFSDHSAHSISVLRAL